MVIWFYLPAKLSNNFSIVFLRLYKVRSQFIVQGLFRLSFIYMFQTQSRLKAS